MSARTLLTVPLGVLILFGCPSQPGQNTPVFGLRVTGGDNQTGLISTQLPVDLEVTYDDGSGNVGANQTITWAVTAGGGTLAAASTTTNSQGKSTNQLTLAGQAGVEKVQVTAGTSSVTFTATAVVPSTSCAAAGTVHNGGTVTANGTWTALASPHHVTANVTFLGATLTIQPGALVCLGDKVSITVDGGGTLTVGPATPTASLTVTFMGDGTVPAGWDGLVVHGLTNAPSTITNAVLDHPDQGIETDLDHPVEVVNTVIQGSKHHALRLLSSGSKFVASVVDQGGTAGDNPVEIGSSGGASPAGQIQFQGRVRGSAGTDAVVIFRSDVALGNCEIIGNAGTGVLVVGNVSNVTVNGCNLTGNGSFAIDNQAAQTVTADGDWWGQSGGPSAGETAGPVAVTNPASAPISVGYAPPALTAAGGASPRSRRR